MARRLWSRLTALPADEPSVRALDGALVLLIDHDLAASTLAARVAASARAHPYAVVSAGLGALDGPLHGGPAGWRTGCWPRCWSAAARRPWWRTNCATAGRCPASGTGSTPVRTRAPAPCSACWRRCPPRGRRWTRPGRWRRRPPARPAHANIDLALAVLSVSARCPPKRARRCSRWPGRRAGSRTRWRSTRNGRCGCARWAGTRPAPARPLP
ncbi:citrate/2-methylcitrate synthase [Streptomyces sp. M19]